MRIRLTDIAVRKLALPASGQKTYWDEATPGFGIRCSTRSKSYVVMYGSRRRLKTIGRYPELGLAEARKRAKLHFAQHQSRTDNLGNFDYHSVLAEYLSDVERRLRPSTLEGYHLYLKAIQFSGPIDNIKRQDILRKIREYTDSPSSQNYAFTTFKVFLNWLVRHQYLHANPLAGLNRPHPSQSRDRVMDRDEVKTLLKYTRGHHDRYSDIVSLLLMTGQRRAEIAELRWSEIDGDWLTFEPNRTKNKQRQEVPIPSMAVDLLQSIDGGKVYVFGTQESDAPFNGWARAQRRLLRETGLNPFTLHDLRRTFATIHAELGTPIHVTERLLNHRSGAISGVAAVYNRYQYRVEMSSAMYLYGEYLTELIS